MKQSAILENSFFYYLNKLFSLDWFGLVALWLIVASMLESPQLFQDMLRKVLLHPC
jgi:hypothetical protein